MEFQQTNIAGSWVISPAPHRDARGRFMRAWCEREFSEQGIVFHPVQANMGFSIKQGTVRGMHFQVAPAPEAKLVRCTRGSMFDVLVDMRSDSQTYLQWFGVKLNPENGRMLYVPEGCAHGYQTLVDDTEMHYMTSAFYVPFAARGARFNDPAFEIEWPLAPTVVSEQDENWPLIEQRR